MTRAKKNAAPPAPVSAVLHPDDVKQYTQTEVATRCRVNRTTVLRMEQRRELPEPTWARLPTPHRVYSENDIKHIKQTLKTRSEKAGRKFLDESQEIAHQKAASGQ